LLGKNKKKKKLEKKSKQLFKKTTLNKNILRVACVQILKDFCCELQVGSQYAAEFFPLQKHPGVAEELNVPKAAVTYEQSRK
jgi:hypothetical protein